jgi:multidrug efflux pump subunit AcrB
VDFAQSEERETGDLKEALVQAGAVRFRPIALTAAAVVVASLVMLFDPIFQGLAISMMFGAVGATALTLVAVPLLYMELVRPAKTAEREDGEDGETSVAAEGEPHT